MHPGNFVETADPPPQLPHRCSSDLAARIMRDSGRRRHARGSGPLWRDYLREVFLPLVLGRGRIARLRDSHRETRLDERLPDILAWQLVRRREYVLFDEWGWFRGNVQVTTRWTGRRLEIIAVELPVELRYPGR